MIEVHHLRKEYTETETPTVALDDASFIIKKGEFVSIMGPSGSGKSTLLHILSFLDRPTGGSYTFLGKPEGVVANNLFNYAIGTIFTASPKSILFGEFYGNTSGLGDAETPEGVVTNTGSSQEISGGENVGAIGYGYYLKKELLISLGVSYNNNNAILFRPGIEWKFGGKKLKQQ